MVATLRRARAKRYKPIIVWFFEKDIWYVRIQPHGSAEGRGEEILVRKQVIR